MSFHENPYELNQKIFTTLKSLSCVSRENRLIALKDRELALALFYASDDECKMLCSCLGARKASRVQDELQLQKRLAVTKEQYIEAAHLVLKALQTGNSKKRIQSFIRPRKYREP